jgi:hypothetical protein
LGAAEALATEARRANRPIETLLTERGILSARRVERLQLHVRYKSLRKVDKAYAKVALKGGLVDEATVSAALDLQRRRFEENRECLRLGAILVQQRRLTDALDRQIRSRVAKLSAAESGSASAAATLLDDSASRGAPGSDVELKGDSDARSVPTYEAIDSAVNRVEAIRRVAEDISESERTLAVDKPLTRDSAAEFENACVLLARRRMGVDATAKPVTRSGAIKKSGGLRLGA